MAVATQAEADPIAGCLMRPGGGMDGGGSGDRLEVVGAMGKQPAGQDSRASKANGDFYTYVIKKVCNNV